MVPQAQSLLEFTAGLTTHSWGASATVPTSAGVSDLCIRVRRNRRRALCAAFLHAARNQVAPQRSISRLLSQS